MGLYNPYREYDKGMDDAYMGREPQKKSTQYQEGYCRCKQLEEEEDKRIEENNLLKHPNAGGNGG